MMKDGQHGHARLVVSARPKGVRGLRPTLFGAHVVAHLVEGLGEVASGLRVRRRDEIVLGPLWIYVGDALRSDSFCDIGTGSSLCESSH